MFGILGRLGYDGVTSKTKGNFEEDGRNHVLLFQSLQGVVGFASRPSMRRGKEGIASETCRS